MNGMPLDIAHLPDMRAALCLVGQLAAPMQSLWVCSQVRQWAARLFHGLEMSPLQQLLSFKARLVQQRDDKWLTLDMFVEGTLCFRDSFGPRRELCQGPLQVHQLARAEAAFLSPGKYGHRPGFCKLLITCFVMAEIMITGLRSSPSVKPELLRLRPVETPLSWRPPARVPPPRLRHFPVTPCQASQRPPQLVRMFASALA